MRIATIFALVTATQAGACGSDGSTGLTAESLPPLGTNSALIVIDGGPNPTVAATLNGIFVTVTVCKAGTQSCQVIDHVLVDTGSEGLRIVSSEVQALGLTRENATSGAPLLECGVFGEGFTWGPVVVADMQIAAEIAASAPIQIIDDAGDPQSFTVPPACSSAGSGVRLESTTLGAKGILGVGRFAQDCGTTCASQATSQYYACASLTACVQTKVAVPLQTANPVALLAADNNGVLIMLPGVPADGAARVDGRLIFGIGTQANNFLGGATVYAQNTSASCHGDNPDDCGDIVTDYSNAAGSLNQSLTASFLDSGTTILIFPDSTIPLCTSAGVFQGLYCPSSTLTLHVTNRGYNGTSGSFDVHLANAETLLNSNAGHIAFDAVGGSAGTAVSGVYTGFAWGVPFFLGRAVFTAMDGAPTPGGTGPYWAY